QPRPPTALRERVRLSARYVVERIGVRAVASGLATVETVDLPHVARLELEVEDRDVLPNPLRCDRLRKHDVAVLDLPAQHDLGDRLAVAPGELEQNRIVQHPALSDRRPRLRRDSMLEPVVDDFVVPEVRIELDLVHGRHDVRLSREPLEVPNLK